MKYEGMKKEQIIKKLNYCINQIRNNKEGHLIRRLEIIISTDGALNLNCSWNIYP